MTEWSAESQFPKPDVEAQVQNEPLNEHKRYDIFALGKFWADPWFARMRGVLSQVFFQNNCNGITPAQLSLLLMADQGEKVNWGLLVGEIFRKELRGHRRSTTYSSPIGPFLTAYITHYLGYVRRNGHHPVMGTFLDVQRELASAKPHDPAAPGPSKRPRLSELAMVPTAATVFAGGTRVTKFQEQRHTMVTCMEQMLQFVSTTEKDLATMEARHQNKLNQAVQAAQVQAQAHLESTRKELRQQLEEAEQTLTNLRNRVANLELEVTATQDHVDMLTKEKTGALERAEKLEHQLQEFRARCKELTEAHDALTRKSGAIAQAPTAEELAKLHQERRDIEQAKENFEANRVGWIHEAARLIATHAYSILHGAPPKDPEPPQAFLDQCIDQALVALDLETSEHDWEASELDLFEIPADEEAPPNMEPLQPPPANPVVQLPAISLPSTIVLDQGNPAERVDIPELLTDTEVTPQPSPRLPSPIQGPPSPPPPTVHIRSKPIKFHKDALKRIEEEFGLESEASDDSEAEDELETAVTEVTKYFAAQPDLASLYGNPESENVQCLACNRLLGKTVYDVYQHAVTSRSKHNLLHRGVAAAIAGLYNNQAPPRRHGQVPREETRPDRRPAYRRSRG